MSLSAYYCAIFFVFLALCIWNAQFAVTYSKDVCYSVQLASGGRVLRAHDFGGGTRALQQDTASNSSSTTPAAETVPKTGTLTKVPLVMAIAYASIAAFVLLGLLGIRCFSRMPPEQFGKLGWCMTALGIFVRNFAGVIRVTHYVVLLVVLVQFILIFSASECKNAVHYVQKTGADASVAVEEHVGLMYTQAVLVNLVNILAWSALHYLIPCAKTCIDEEAYLYEARDKDTHILFYLFCQFFGP